MQVFEDINAQMKIRLVLESLSGRSTADICEEYGIEMKQLWTWRKTFLMNAQKIFEPDHKIEPDSGRRTGCDALEIYIDKIVSEKILKIILDSLRPSMDRSLNVLEPKSRFYRVLEREFEKSVKVLFTQSAKLQINESANV